MSARDPLERFIRETRKHLRRLDRRVSILAADEPGMVVMYPRATIAEAPPGWYRLTGQDVDPDDDPELYELYGPTLPDLPNPPAEIDPSNTLGWIIRAG